MAWAARLPSVVAGAALGLAPVWWHVDLVNPGIDNITAVFSEVAVYPSDLCLVALAILAATRPVPMRTSARWLAYGLTLLAGVALVSSLPSLDPVLGGGLAGHLALLGLAWLGVRSDQVSRTGLAAALVTSGGLQSVLAMSQFTLQQPLIPDALHLPWLPSDAAVGGTPVVIDAAGQRLLRGFGTFPHPNILGGYLAVALVCLPILAQRWPRSRPLWWLVGAVIAGGLLASFSRAGWLAALLGLAVWGWPSIQHRRAVWSLLGVIAVAFAAIALSPVAPIVGARLTPLAPDANPLERGSIDNRLALDRDAVSEALHHLPLGVGAANDGLAALADGYQEGWGEPAPNLALLIGVELGLPGVLAATIVVCATIRMLRTPDGVDTAAMAVCLSLLVLAMLDHYLWTMPPGRVIAWTFLAVLGTRVPAGARDGDQRAGVEDVDASAPQRAIAEPRGLSALARATARILLPKK